MRVLSIAQLYAYVNDNEIIKIAIKNNGFLITEDKDFGDELVFKKKHLLDSLFIRFQDVQIEERIKLIVSTLVKNRNDLMNSFSVLSSKKIRIRKY